MIIGISGKKQHGKNTIANIIKYLTCGENKSFEEFLNGPFKYSYNCPNGVIWQEKSFASKLKQIVCLLIGCTIEQLEDSEFKESKLSSEWNWVFDKNGHRGPVHPDMIDRQKQYTVRELLQRVGTEAMRNNIHTNIWVNSLMSDYKIEVIPNENYGSNRTKPKNWIITKEEEHEYLLDNSHWVYKDEVNIISPNWLITDVRFPNEAEAIKEKGGLLIRINRLFKAEGNQNAELLDNHPSETALDNYEHFDEIIFNDGNIEDLVEKVKTILVKHKII